VKAESHITTILSALAGQRCHQRNCGSVCLCEPCHARAALQHMSEEGLVVRCVKRKKEKA
jgi:hypothetical protein